MLDLPTTRTLILHFMNVPKTPSIIYKKNTMILICTQTLVQLAICHSSTNPRILRLCVMVGNGTISLSLIIVIFISIALALNSILKMCFVFQLLRKIYYIFLNLLMITIVHSIALHGVIMLRIVWLSIQS